MARKYVRKKPIQTHDEQRAARLSKPPIERPPVTRYSQMLVVRPPPSAELVKDAHYDLNNPRSMVRLLPHFMFERVKFLPTRFLSLTENELLKECFMPVDGVYKPSEEARRLRIAFWDEYDRCQRYEEKAMDMFRVTTGICTMSYFSGRFITDYRLIAWLLTPPPLYVNALKDIHDMSLRQLLEVAKLPIERNEKGQVNTALLHIQHTIFEHVDLRLKGAIIQRIDQRSVSVNMDVDPNSPEGRKIMENARGPLTMSEVESKIKALEEKSLKLQAPMKIDTDLMREVSPVVVDIPHSNANLKRD